MYLKSVFGPQVGIGGDNPSFKRQPHISNSEQMQSTRVNEITTLTPTDTTVKVGGSDESVKRLKESPTARN